MSSLAVEEERFCRVIYVMGMAEPLQSDTPAVVVEASLFAATHAHISDSSAVETPVAVLRALTTSCKAETEAKPDPAKQRRKVEQKVDVNAAKRAVDNALAGIDITGLKQEAKPAKHSSTRGPGKLTINASHKVTCDRELLTQHYTNRREESQPYQSRPKKFQEASTKCRPVSDVPSPTSYAKPVMTPMSPSQLPGQSGAVYQGLHAFAGSPLGYNNAQHPLPAYVHNSQCLGPRTLQHSMSHGHKPWLMSEFPAMSLADRRLTSGNAAADFLSHLAVPLQGNPWVPVGPSPLQPSGLAIRNGPARTASSPLVQQAPFYVEQMPQAAPILGSIADNQLQTPNLLVQFEKVSMEAILRSESDPQMQSMLQEESQLVLYILNILVRVVKGLVDEEDTVADLNFMCVSLRCHLSEWHTISQGFKIAMQVVVTIATHLFPPPKQVLNLASSRIMEILAGCDASLGQTILTCQVQAALGSESVSPDALLELVHYMAMVINKNVGLLENVKGHCAGPNVRSLNRSFSAPSRPASGRMLYRNVSASRHNTYDIDEDLPSPLASPSHAPVNGLFEAQLCTATSGDLDNNIIGSRSSSANASFTMPGSGGPSANTSFTMQAGSGHPSFSMSGIGNANASFTMPGSPCSANGSFTITRSGSANGGFPPGMVPQGFVPNAAICELEHTVLSPMVSRSNSGTATNFPVANPNFITNGPLVEQLTSMGLIDNTGLLLPGDVRGHSHLVPQQLGSSMDHLHRMDEFLCAGGLRGQVPHMH